MKRKRRRRKTASALLFQLLKGAGKVDKQEKNTRQSAAYLLMKTLLIGLLTAFVSNFLLQFFQNELELSLVYAFIFEWHTEIFMISTGILILLYLWLTALTGNRWGSSFLIVGVSAIIGLINWQKIAVRGEPLYPSDFQMIFNLPFLIKMVPLSFILVIAILLLIFLTGSVLYFKRRGRKPTSFSKKSLLKRVLLFSVTSILLVYVGLFNHEGNKIRAAYDPYAYWIPYSQQMNYYNNGFVGGFLYNLKTESIDKPVEYSETNIKKLVAAYEKEADRVNQVRNESFEEINLVFIMNESFSDPLALEGITANKDPIPNTRKILAETTSGKVFAEGYGGGTSNSEYEALTGLSLEPLSPNIATPYTQMSQDMKKVPVVTKLLADRGYKTTAIHPFDTTMYKRSKVYDSFGFDTFLYDDTMKFAERIAENPYISDESAYKEVLDRLESTEQPQFIHLVTMQNHMGYEGKYPETLFDVEGSGNKGEANNYFQDIEYSDQAMVPFLDRINQLDQKTMIVFWGDHLPSLYNEDILENNDIRSLYETPGFIYANFDTAKEDFDTISPIYFMNHVLKAANAKVTPYQAFLLKLENALPAMEKGRYLEGNEKGVEENRDLLQPETQALLEQYAAIQYDLLEGKGYSEKLGFYR